MINFRANLLSLRRLSLLFATAAFAGLATPALAFPTVTNKAEVERLRMMLVDQAITCTKVEVAWYLTDPADTTGPVRMWKVTCSNNREYGIIYDTSRNYGFIKPWDQFQADLPPMR